MKITDLKIHVVRREAGKDNISKIPDWMEAPVITVMTDEGIEGISCGKSGLAMAHYLLKLKPYLIGENPLYIEKIWQEVVSADRILMYPQPVVGTLDLALWDIAGKVAGLPIYQMLGAYRDKVRAYYSCMCDTKEAYIEKALEAKSLGFSAYKHKPLPRHSELVSAPERDLDVCRAIRDAVGDDMLLMFDPIGWYDYEEALKVGRGLDELNYYWYEEPVSDQNIFELKMLKAKLDVPIAGLEAYPVDLRTINQYLMDGAVDIIRCNSINHYGITQLKKLAALSEAFGQNYEMTTTANPIGNAANLHVSCAMKNCEFFEWWTPENQLWDFGVVKESLRVDKNGDVHAPQGPGLGMELDWDYIHSHTIATL